MNKKEQRCFDMARAVSYMSDYGKIKIGAVIISKKNLISVASNMRKSHPLQKQLNKFRFSPTDTSKDYIHAELSAIIKANTKNLADSIMYIYREDRNGNLAMCRPCPACMKEIQKVGIKKIYYTTRNGFCKEEIAKEL